VPVYCTRARYVTKPRGAKAGTVNVARGQTLKVRPDISFAIRLKVESKVFNGEIDDH
jgi:hypothetical protein